MRKDALFKRYELFAAAATVAAHANSPDQWFRQRDVRFMIELFTNWVESSLEGLSLVLNNTQVQRYLDDLVNEGSARRSVRKKHPMYTLTRTGLIDLLTRIVEKPFYFIPENFFFLYYFIHNYKPRLEALIKTQGKKFPLALKIEVETLLDCRALVERQLDCAQKELRKLEERIGDAIKASKLSTKLYRDGAEHIDVVGEVERLYPYELNSQKSLTELFSEIPEDLGRWELETGGPKRVEQMWHPTRTMLQTYIKWLEKFHALPDE